MIGLLGKKVGMTQVFDDKGARCAVTILEVGPCYVAGLRTVEKDGYSAVKLAYKPAKEKHLNKPKQGFFKKVGIDLYRCVKEIRTQDVEGLVVGSELKADNFESGDYVDIQGTSIGKGFQGVVKRHHFKGGEATHGAKFGRESGSIAQGSATPSRVPKGRRMAGQMGNSQVTIQNLQVVKVDPENNLVIVKGNVPGAEEGLLVIRTSLKKAPEDRKWKVVESQKEETVEESTEPQASEEEVSASDTPAEESTIEANQQEDATTSDEDQEASDKDSEK